MSARHAVYFAPAHGSPWWQFGAHWLGRDEFQDVTLAPSVSVPFEPAVLHAITAAPRRYGFHATLKAPFRLSGEHTLDDLLTHMTWLAATLEPVALGPLHAVTLGDFVALVPHATPPALQALATTCMAELDDLRAPLVSADLARRRVETLDPREAELLHLYGYPYVMERLRFHFSLTGPIAGEQQLQVKQAVAAEVARLNREAPLSLDRLCLFVEATPGASFQRIADMEVGA